MTVFENAGSKGTTPLKGIVCRDETEGYSYKMMFCDYESFQSEVVIEKNE